MNLFKTILLGALFGLVLTTPVWGYVHLVIDLDKNTTTIANPTTVSKVIVDKSKLSKLELELENLTKEQYQVMLGALHYGEEYELGLTLAAIAWKESGFGKFTMNLDDGKYGSFSPYHIRLDYASQRHNIKTGWSRSRLAERLLNDLEFATKEAARVLQSFRGKKCNYSCSIARYNGGYTAHKNKKALAYAEDIKKRVEAIKGYISRNTAIVEVDITNFYGDSTPKTLLAFKDIEPDVSK